MRATHGWAEVDRERKREIIAAIASGTATKGPAHAELDLTDRCNVACYFCNQQDLRTKDQIPIKRTTELIDELADTGLKSVRLSGGGDPLFHRDIFAVLDHLAARGVVVDNVTTNGVALGPEIATRLVQNHAREVIFSLNAVDAADYHRMMQVKPALFDKVLENIRNLVAIRGDSIYPSIVIQFLLDRQNFLRLVEMYELGRSLNPDRIAINTVLEIPRDRIQHQLLLAPEDREAIRPFVEEILRKDKDAGLLQIDFPIAGWNEVLAEARAKLDVPAKNLYPTAASFKDENAGCFFAWYTAAITGNGDIRPCCLLLNPDYPSLGNTLQGKFADHWNGPMFQRMREEMREVLLMKGKVAYRPGRFQVLAEQCVKPDLCWLKNMYFRGDEEFYKELGIALDQARKKEVRWIGTPKQMIRRLEMFAYDRPFARKLYGKLRDHSRPFRAWLRQRLGISLFST